MLSCPLHMHGQLTAVSSASISSANNATGHRRHLGSGRGNTGSSRLGALLHIMLADWWLVHKNWRHTFCNKITVVCHVPYFTLYILNPRVFPLLLSGRSFQVETFSLNLTHTDTQTDSIYECSFPSHFAKTLIVKPHPKELFFWLIFHQFLQWSLHFTYIC